MSAEFSVLECADVDLSRFRSSFDEPNYSAEALMQFFGIDVSAADAFLERLDRTVFIEPYAEFAEVLCESAFLESTEGFRRVREIKWTSKSQSAPRKCLVSEKLLIRAGWI